MHSPFFPFSVTRTSCFSSSPSASVQTTLASPPQTFCETAQEKLAVTCAVPRHRLFRQIKVFQGKPTSFVRLPSLSSDATCLWAISPGRPVTRQPPRALSTDPPLPNEPSHPRTCPPLHSAPGRCQSPLAGFSVRTPLPAELCGPANERIGAVVVVVEVRVVGASFLPRNNTTNM